ncbi:CFI-box-CTERM domain-containing protein [Sphingomicrobium sediminis]|uniref:Uncharacterized protein n=1 Tax=Sphingomicrobium sediminis TaxID=2950949 RepID=A0A9X2EEU1_9SPHN|nr:CFI-box-CTERM domain-containing protein [Sphingomicrobium sediminis]MCM8556650.1 hypothetical protein [Sphingomicrobium sediminis]
MKKTQRSLLKRAASLLTLVGVLPASNVTAQELPDCRIMEEWGDEYGAVILAENESGGVDSFVEVYQRPLAVSTSSSYSSLSGRNPYGILTMYWKRSGNSWYADHAEMFGPDVGYSMDPIDATVTIEVGGRTVSRQQIEMDGIGNDLKFDTQSLASASENPFFVTISWSEFGQQHSVKYRYSPIQREYSFAVEQYDGLLRAFRAGRCKVEASGCFLTSAACDGIGLADDCWELQTLRAFRDDWLVHQQGGLEDVALYYAVAPAIAARLAEQPRALVKLYWSRIVPSAIAAKLGLNRVARRLYTGMISDLLEQTGVASS